MQITNRTARALLLTSMFISLVAASSLSGDATGRRNPALPNPDDLITFDDSAPSPSVSAAPAPTPDAGVIQRAFPLYYGAGPDARPEGAAGVATTLPVSPAAPTAVQGTPVLPGASLATGMPVTAGVPSETTNPLLQHLPPFAYGPAAPVTPNSPLAAPGGGVTAVTSGGEGFIDYQDYLQKQQAEELAASGKPGDTASATPAPSSSAAAVAPAVSPAALQTPAREVARAADTSDATAEKPLPMPLSPPVLAESPSTVASGPQPSSGPVADTMPIPLPPPAEVVAMAESEGRSSVFDMTGAAESTPAARPTPETPPTLGEVAAAPSAGTGEAPRPSEQPVSPSVDPLEARRPSSPAEAPGPDLNQVKAAFNSLKTYCESDSLGSAAEIYAQMPDFGRDEELNRLRADAANLLILGLARRGDLIAARRIYDSVPTDMPGFDARLAKARAVINLTTYYIRANRFTDAFNVLMDVGNIQNRSALNNELFRLMARMIPYLDNAEETDKAQQIYDLLLSEVKSPGTAALFSENVRASVVGYYTHYVDKSDSPVHRRRRLDFLEHMFSSLTRWETNSDIRSLRKFIGDALMERYAGDPDRASNFFVEP